MTRILDSKKFRSRSTNGPISFEYSPDKSSGLYTRYLSLKKKRMNCPLVVELAIFFLKDLKGQIAKPQCKTLMKCFGMV